MMQLPVFRRPEVWSFAPNCITESAENLLIVLFCHCLSYRCVFVMHNSTDIKEHSITLILLRTCRAFFGLGDSGCFHCDDCAFVSGSYPYTHDSSPVITVFRNSGSVLIVSSRSCATSTRSSFCSADSSLGTNFAATAHVQICTQNLMCGIFTDPNFFGNLSYGQTTISPYQIFHSLNNSCIPSGLWPPRTLFTLR